MNTRQATTALPMNVALVRPGQLVCWFTVRSSAGQTIAAAVSGIRGAASSNELGAIATASGASRTIASTALTQIRTK